MQTHRGRDVEVVAGDAAAISTRGSQITELGESMVEAASTLEGIKDGTIVGRGYAMDKIKEVIDDVHKDLDEAGRRYTPAGSTLSAYATALAQVQSRMQTVVADCESSLTALQTAQSNAADASAALSSHNTNTRLNPPEEDAAAANTAAGQELASAASGAQSALSTASSDHDDNLAAFDAEYDTWHEAYETAVSGLTDANDIGKDSTWEDIAGVLAVVAEWVSWVGLAIAVLGLIIGGPFFAIAALVVGVIALALTVALMFDGRKGWGDLAWAIVGVLPIGKLGQGLGKFFKAIPKQLTGPLGQIRNIHNISALPKNGWRAASKLNFANFVNNVSRTRLTGPFTLAGLGQRFLGGANRSFTVAFQEAAAVGTGYGNRLYTQLPQALQQLAKSDAPTLFEQAWNVYKWADKGVAMTNGRPSGGLSPAGLLNGITR